MKNRLDRRLCVRVSVPLRFCAKPFNRATTALRQPGSSIKPIVFAKALEEGIPINRVFNDTLLEIPLENGQIYTPGDIDNKFLGPMTLREAPATGRPRRRGSSLPTSTARPVRWRHR